MKGFEQISQLIALSPGVARRIRLGICLGCLAGILTVLGMGGCAFAVGGLITAPMDTWFFYWLIMGGIGLCGGYLARALADQLTHSASYDLEVTLRHRVTDMLARLPLGDVYQLGAGRIKKIVHDDVKGLHAAVADASPFVGVGVSQPLAALLLLLIVQWKLFLLVCLMFPLVMLCMAWMTRDYDIQQQRYNHASEQINAAVIEFVQGMPVVRTFDGNRVGFRRFSQKVEAFTAAVADWLAASKQASRANSIVIGPLPTLLLILLAAPWMLDSGWISLRDLLLALMIGTLPVQAVMPLMFLSQLLNDARAAARRICDILEMTPLSEPTIPQYPQGADIVLENVTFSYRPDDLTPALQGVNLTVPANTVCALVGASGSGKSTLARLVPRFWDVSAGAIRLGGVDVRDIPSRTLLQQVAFVFQDPFLVMGSVADNIRLMRPEATDAEVELAARSACAHEFIISLDEGYATPVGERGTRLSGGQRQRITLARALISDAPIVILDEPTAWVDAESEAAIQQAIDVLSRERTVIIVAHRLSTITHADQIVVLERGSVAEYGRHDTLIAAGGRYAALWQRYKDSNDWWLARKETEENDEII